MSTKNLNDLIEDKTLAPHKKVMKSYYLNKNTPKRLLEMKAQSKMPCGLIIDLLVRDAHEIYIKVKTKK